ncbi:Uncharacterised protein [Halioglobus japonicus]|nr:Uncharacterised protein [Halioglobus japonicus]
MSNEEGSITTEIRGHILIMGLNRPEKYNGYTPTMAEQLVAAYTQLDEDDNLLATKLLQTQQIQSLVSGNRPTPLCKRTHPQVMIMLSSDQVPTKVE